MPATADRVRENVHGQVGRTVGTVAVLAEAMHIPAAQTPVVAT